MADDLECLDKLSKDTGGNFVSKGIYPYQVRSKGRPETEIHQRARYVFGPRLQTAQGTWTLGDPTRFRSECAKD
ncbi:unnamed protein product [Clavelina lepadiformis]|uniref:Uncharacterized protein n=1 Tax=Clavelina lepadiformis TaxID=159417 RepID=A0ABP0FUG4_CLALP